MAGKSDGGVQGNHSGPTAALFHETKRSEHGFVVEQRHSMSGSDGVQIGLSATHSGLIQFEGRDANYKTFVEKFREMIHKAKDSELLETKRKAFDHVTGERAVSLNKSIILM